MSMLTSHQSDSSKNCRSNNLSNSIYCLSLSFLVFEILSGMISLPPPSPPHQKLNLSEAARNGVKSVVCCFMHAFSFYKVPFNLHIFSFPGWTLLPCQHMKFLSSWGRCIRWVISMTVQLLLARSPTETLEYNFKIPEIILKRGIIWITKFLITLQ